jgi:hypothetical protein
MRNPKYAVYAIAAYLALVGVLAISTSQIGHTQGSSQQGGLPALEARVAALEATIGGQNSAIADLQNALAAEKAASIAADAALQSNLDSESPARQAADSALQAGIAVVADKVVHFSRVGNEVYITGANLHLLNGMGTTDTANGLGNLIVGYNQARGLGQDIRSGSHNIVVGDEHNFSSHGGLVAGLRNAILGEYSCVCGGQFNTAGGPQTSVLGGSSNLASGPWSYVSGGGANTAGGFFSSVSGGDFNQAKGTFSSVSGGGNNFAGGDSASISGGLFNQALATHSSVSGGQSNTAGGNFSSISGGSTKTQLGNSIWQGGTLTSGP